MAPLITDPRTVTEHDFPVTGTSAQQWRFLLNYAMLAPSEYNTQPWLFRIHDTYVEIYADRARRLPVLDPDERELMISCGAAYQNLRIALHHFGYQETLEFLYDQSKTGLVASIRMGMRASFPPEENALFSAITHRRTNRHAFEDRPVPTVLLEDLKLLTGREGARLHIIQDEQTREKVTNLIVAGDRTQWTSPQFRQELAAWLATRGRKSRDGLPGYTGAKGSLAGSVSPFVVRTFNLWREEVARDRQLTGAAPVLAVLSTYSDTSGDWFLAGQTIEKVLLYICAEGLQASFVNQPIEVPTLRVWLCNILESTEHPQAIIRLGYGSEVAPTPRRGVQDVLQEYIDNGVVCT
jgi:hypothetical protein